MQETIENFMDERTLTAADRKERWMNYSRRLGLAKSLRIGLLQTLFALSIFLLTGQGTHLEAAREAPLMSELIGLNGHSVQFDSELYAPLCKKVRDFHNLGWDIGEDNTSRSPEFPYSYKEIGWNGKGRRIPAHKGKINWQNLYQGWVDAGFEINASIQFGRLLPEKWENPYEDAYRYGKAFARFFGPSGEHKLVTSMEVGNEPANNEGWTDELYMEVFRGMAEGIRAGDPAMQILTCTSEAPPTDRYSKSLDLFKDYAELYDVISIHKYAFLEKWPTYKRSHPEDPNNHYIEHIKRSLAWRDQHAPDKPIWITEFGYDAPSPNAKPGKNAKWVGVTDRQQAQWIVRSYLLFSALGIERAYLFWANDKDTAWVHMASGVTRNYQPKPSYWAMRHLSQRLGDYRYQREVPAQEGATVYEYVHGTDPTQLVWVAWSPTGDERHSKVDLDVPGRLLKAERMAVSSEGGVAVELQQQSGKLVLPLTEDPLYLRIARR